MYEPRVGKMNKIWHLFLLAIGIRDLSYWVHGDPLLLREFPVRCFLGLICPAQEELPINCTFSAGKKN